MSIIYSNNKRNIKNLTFASSVVGGSVAVIMSATAGRTATSLSALAGASGTFGGAAISSGMATIGSVVGGGMTAGSILTTAVPVAIVGALIYGVVKIFED